MDHSFYIFVQSTSKNIKYLKIIRQIIFKFCQHDSTDQTIFHIADFTAEKIIEDGLIEYKLYEGYQLATWGGILNQTCRRLIFDEVEHA